MENNKIFYVRYVNCCNNKILHQGSYIDCEKFIEEKFNNNENLIDFLQIFDF